ncbi:MAG TPA: UDP-N-acetylmuramate dehydrogenase [Candidatus Paceibacterota bacterium]|nr:UDP-N-acetylmuramate dehydrogenase [Candidatus Paceibacterota bacterium]HMO82743.1 UDP-N-acetylmuramate dehydrogenase [Candidatus Paceibacterota bacterium]
MALVIEENVNLAKYSTLQTGGAARYFVRVSSEEEVKQAASFAQQNSLLVLCLGGGSNVLIADEGFAGLVILNELKGREYQHNNDEVTLVCGAGEVLDEVVAETVARGYWGLENLSAIPGTVGATPIQNVGAYGVEVAQLITKVETMNLVSGEKKIFSKVECNFGYRDSFFKTSEGKKYFITHVHFTLKKNSTAKINYLDLQKYFVDTTPTLADIRKAITLIRSQKFPDWKVVGTAGSFFKNPFVTAKEAERLLALYPDLPTYEAEPGLVKIPLGYVLDKLCGLKGYRSGAVGLFQAQALVLVNYGGATTSEIKNFAAEIAEKVFAKTKIIISPEVTYVSVE